MEVKLDTSWKELLRDEFEKPYFQQLVQFVKDAYHRETVYPPGKLIFNALDKCPPEKVKVVIIGQDPYHGPGQAHGLCFSVQKGVRTPPSLQNIFKEISRDLEVPMPTDGDLTRWAEQGVLLLNATLTVRSGAAGSHQGKGWEIFTDAIIHKIAMLNSGLVFMLWGSYAQKKGAFIDPQRHLVLKSPHPSPLSAHRGFLGNGHFSSANQYLKQQQKTPVVW